MGTAQFLEPFARITGPPQLVAHAAVQADAASRSVLGRQRVSARGRLATRSHYSGIVTLTQRPPPSRLVNPILPPCASAVCLADAVE